MFDRSASGMAPTAAGVEALENFLSSADHDVALRERLHGAASAAVPDLRVGLLEGLVSLAPALTKRLLRRSAGTKLAGPAYAPFEPGAREGDKR